MPTGAAGNQLDAASGHDAACEKNEPERAAYQAISGYPSQLHGDADCRPRAFNAAINGFKHLKMRRVTTPTPSRTSGRG